jgi:hypothetical protein
MPGESENGFYVAEFDESSIAAVHLLQNVVYQDEGRVWELVLTHRTRLDSYFNRIGLRLVIDESEGFAYLRQLEESELGQVRGYDQLPKLFRKKRLSYDATLACVLLRMELRRFEAEELDNARCIIGMDELFAQWKTLVALATLEELKFVREFTKEPQEWEIRRILKARLPVAELEGLLQDLKAAAAARPQRIATGESHE